MELLGITFFLIFVFSSVIYCIFVIKGLRVSRARGKSELFGYLTLGVQSKSDVYRYLKSGAARKAVFFLKARNWSLILFLIISVVDFLRSWFF